MKFQTLFVVGMSAALLALAPMTASARSLKEIRSGNELRICIAGSSAPFYQTNAEAFARFLSLQPVVRLLDNWDQQFHDASGVTVKDARYEARLLANGNCDVFPNDLHMTDWRQTKMLLVPYYTTRKVIVAHRELRKTLKQPSDLAGHSAAVQKGTAYETWLNQQNKSSFKANPVIIELLPTAESMKKVDTGEADFTVIGAEGAFKWVRGERENLDLLFPVDELVEVGWGISPAADDLRAQLERFFAENLRVGSDLDRAWQKQYGISRMEYQLFEASFDSEKADLKAILAWALPLGTGVLGVVLAMLFWTRRLRREIVEHRRTEAILRETQEAVARESARRLAITEILVHLQQVQSLEEFGRVLLSDLSRYILLAQAIFCIWDTATESLHAVAHYAGGGTTPAESLAQFHTTGSLIDRCLATRQPVLIEQPAPNYLRFRSGLGHGAPAAVLIYPICQLQRLQAVLEIATLKTISSDHRQLIDDLAPIVAVLLDRWHPGASR